MSEADWSRRVMDYAKLMGWRVVHVRPAHTEHGWRTPYEGDSGLPDLIMARGGRTILVELKSDMGKLTAEQQAWLDASDGYCFRPRDWDCVMELLR